MKYSKRHVLNSKQKIGTPRQTQNDYAKRVTNRGTAEKSLNLEKVIDNQKRIKRIKSN